MSWQWPCWYNCCQMFCHFTESGEVETMHGDVGRQFKKLTVFLDGDSHLLAPAHFPASCVCVVFPRGAEKSFVLLLRKPQNVKWLIIKNREEKNLNDLTKPLQSHMLDRLAKPWKSHRKLSIVLCVCMKNLQAFVVVMNRFTWHISPWAIILTLYLGFSSKVSRPDKLAVHVFEVDEDVDKDEVSSLSEDMDGVKKHPLLIFSF